MPLGAAGDPAKMTLRASNGDPPLSFAALMDLEPINANTFRSTAAAFAPGGEFLLARDKNSVRRTYGGHVYAQSVLAAAQTLEHGFVVHSVTGFFTLLGNPDMPFVYKVHRIRTGRNYAVRSVTVTQRADAGTCFTATVSFKRVETAAPWSFQVDARAPQRAPRYADVLAGKHPADHPDYLTTEIESFLRIPEAERAKAKGLTFPGLHTKKVGMRAYNASRPVEERRQLSYYAAVGALPAYATAPNLHAAAHLYASDRNSLFASATMLGLKAAVPMGSLSHTVVFHETGVALAMGEGSDGGRESGDVELRRKRWMVQEAWTDRFADQRLVHHSRLWNSEGRHVATTLQDGMMKLPKDYVHREGKL